MQLYNLLITWSHEVTWQIKNLTSLLPAQVLWPPNLTGLWLMIRNHQPQSEMSVQLRGHMKSGDK